MTPLAYKAGCLQSLTTLGLEKLADKISPGALEALHDVGRPAPGQYTSTAKAEAPTLLRRALQLGKRHPLLAAGALGLTAGGAYGASQLGNGPPEPALIDRYSGHAYPPAPALGTHRR
jgi:hypothetical protein